MCADSVDMERNEKMKTILNEYFDKQSLDEEVEEVEEEDNDPVSLSIDLGRIFLAIPVYNLKMSVCLTVRLSTFWLKFQF